MPVNIGKLVKVLVDVAGTVHEIGEYAAPVVEEIVKRRAKGPARPDTGQEESVEETRAKIAAALETAQAGQAAAEAELDALDRKPR